MDNYPNLKISFYATGMPYLNILLDILVDIALRSDFLRISTKHEIMLSTNLEQRYPSLWHSS